MVNKTPMRSSAKISMIVKSSDASLSILTTGGDLGRPLGRELRRLRRSDEIDDIELAVENPLRERRETSSIFALP